MTVMTSSNPSNIPDVAKRFELVFTSCKDSKTTRYRLGEYDDFDTAVLAMEWFNGPGRKPARPGLKFYELYDYHTGYRVKFRILKPTREHASDALAQSTHLQEWALAYWAPTIEEHLQRGRLRDK